MLEVCIKYSMYDLICHINSCVWSCDTGKVDVYDKSWLKTRENMDVKEIFT